MEQNYQLDSYPRSYGSGADSGGLATPASSQHSRTAPAFSIPRKPVHRGHERTSLGYEPLIDAKTVCAPVTGQSGKKLRFRSYLVWWVPEILASIVAVGCLLTIVGVLRTFNGRSLTNVGLPGPLTLNGVIAAISTVGKAALMVPVGSALTQESWIWFSGNARRQKQCKSRLNDLQLSDDASRGVWGSILFLFLARSRWIAYLGAFVTILSLVFGTFTQQLLSIDQFAVTNLHPDLLPGNLPRSESWQYYSGNPAEVDLTLPLSIRASIYSGMLSNTIDPITVTCTTGNCTWPVTPSLAICGECSSSVYEKQCTETNCTYRMPSGSNITLDTTSFDTGEGIGFVVRSNTQGGKYNTSAGDRLYLSNFDVIGAPYMAFDSGFDNTNTSASECALWMCVQSYSTREVAGKLQENITMRFFNYTIPKEDTYTYGNYTFKELPPEMNPSPNVSYSIIGLGVETFSQTFSSMFNGTALLREGGSVADNDAVDAIWNASPHLNPWILNVATSITNGLRAYASYNSSSQQPQRIGPQRPIYDGTAYQVGIQVRWSWLALPAACVALSNLFLIIVMIKTARSAVVPWKNSLLTFLLFDVDQELKQRTTNDITRWRGVLNAIGDEKVVLVEESKGRWLFKSP